MERVKVNRYKAGSKHNIPTGEIEITMVTTVVMYEVTNHNTKEKTLMSHKRLVNLIKNSTLAISKTKTDEKINSGG